MATRAFNPLPPAKFKDQYWVKVLKWHLYKRHTGKPGWKTRFLFDRLLRTLQHGDLVIDCGANVGSITRMLAANGSTVHAFEPDPYAFSRLLANTADLPHVVCHNAAVGTRDATIQLYRTPEFDQNPDLASISSSVYADKVNVDVNNAVTAQQIDLLSFIENLGQQVAILKIDIEGAEVELLEHMLKAGTLDRCNAVFVETHESRIPSLVERTEQLRRVQRQAAYANKLFLDWE